MRITGRLIILVALLVLVVSCMAPQVTGNAITGKPLLATPTPPPSPTPTAFPVAVIGGAYHLRAAGNAHAPVLGYLYEGDRVTILDEKNGWLKVETADGVTGWVKGDAVMK